MTTSSDTRRPRPHRGADPAPAPEADRTGAGDVPEVSVVFPCLNEELTIGACIRKALEAFQENGLRGEVVVCDNGSADNSVGIAESLEARVVHQPERGYGNAYLKGIAAARGRYIVIADSDDTYDLHEIPRFLTPLREGYDLVMGNRFTGKILPGAMPWLHQYIGNPVLSGILNLFFHTGVGDAHCGMRAFTHEAYPRMRLRTGGMEFASEMVINAAQAGLKITEVPITYYPRLGESKLHSLRDGWRHLRFMLMRSPTHLFVAPGLALFVLGLVLLLALAPGPIIIGGRSLDLHLMVLGSLLAVMGAQVIGLGLFAKTYGVVHDYQDEDRLFAALRDRFTLERGIYLGLVLLVVGFVVDFVILAEWVASGFGALNQVRAALFGSSLMALGTQIVFSSFLLSILGFERTKR
ncbi:MAG: glycosyltransferase family 2 protein [Chloroflexi bacterium]|nr:glycosyltransferase family 2 protein [Chloroflexota bacterium]